MGNCQCTDTADDRPGPGCAEVVIRKPPKDFSHEVDTVYDPLHAAAVSEKLREDQLKRIAELSPRQLRILEVVWDGLGWDPPDWERIAKWLEKKASAEEDEEDQESSRTLERLYDQRYVYWSPHNQPTHPENRAVESHNMRAARP